MGMRKALTLGYTTNYLAGMCFVRRRRVWVLKHSSPERSRGGRGKRLLGDEPDAEPRSTDRAAA
jgi:hypothetical protein